MSYLAVSPAYGRVYKTAEDMIQGFKDGRDFMPVVGGPYLSIRDFARDEPALSDYLGVKLVQVRARRDLCHMVTIPRVDMVWPPEAEAGTEPEGRGYVDQDQTIDLQDVAKSVLGIKD